MHEEVSLRSTVLSANSCFLQVRPAAHGPERHHQRDRGRAVGWGSLQLPPAGNGEGPGLGGRADGGGAEEEHGHREERGGPEELRLQAGREEVRGGGVRGDGEGVGRFSA